MSIQKFVITGGPCAGKTTAMKWIKETFEKEGYRILFIGETATELISGGVTPWDCATNLDYQKFQMKLQLEKEKIFEGAAKTMNSDKILIVCDRGEMDNRAYMTQEDFLEGAAHIGETEESLTNRYDAIFHLVTAAKGAEQFYTTENNTARTETVEEAAALDDRLIAAWKKHPYHKIIENSSDFEGKMKKLIQEMRDFLQKS